MFIWSLCYIVHGTFAQHLTVSRKSLERDVYIANGIIRALKEQLKGIIFLHFFYSNKLEFERLVEYNKLMPSVNFQKIVYPHSMCFLTISQ